MITPTWTLGAINKLLTYPEFTDIVVHQIESKTLLIGDDTTMGNNPVFTINFANLKKDNHYTHYVGKKNSSFFLEGSSLANPFTLKKESERESVLEQYKEWLDEQLKDPMSDQSIELYELINDLRTEGSITLGCFCKPKKCHAEYIAENIYSRIEQIYLASRIDESDPLPTIQIESIDRQPKKASRGKQLPLEREFREIWTRESAESCTRCTLCDNRTHSVWIRGEGKKGLLIIGEAPGQNEDKFALPFIGQSGKMLEVMLQSIGLSSQEDCWIANSVKCRPSENRDPSALEIKKCLPYLISQILELRPKAILALGKYGSQILTGEKKFRISIHRGNIYQLDIGQFVQLDEPLIIPVVPTFHPAYLLRNPQKDIPSPKYYAWKDLLTLSNLLKEE